MGNREAFNRALRLARQDARDFERGRADGFRHVATWGAERAKLAEAVYGEGTYSEGFRQGIRDATGN